MKICCLVNVRSGGGVGAQWYEIVSSLKQKFNGELCVAAVGEKPLESVFRDGGSPYDLVVVCGGDGTVSSVLSFVCGTQTRLALIPLGTGNDLARELQIETPPRANMLSWLTDRAQNPCKEIAVWKIEHASQVRYFINYFSAGFDAEVVHFFDSARNQFPWVAKLLGPFGNRLLYGFGALRYLPKPPLADISVASLDEETKLEIRKLRSLFFSNIRSVMGFATSHPESSALDERLELSVFYHWRNFVHLIIPFSPWKPVRYPGAGGWRIRGLPEGCKLQADGETIVLHGEEGELTLAYAGKVSIVGAT